MTDTRVEQYNLWTVGIPTEPTVPVFISISIEFYWSYVSQFSLLLFFLF